MPNCLVRMTSTLAAAGLLLVPQPAASLTEAMVLQPHVDQITLCTEALRELQRQADIRHDELSAWQVHARALREEMARNATRLSQTNELSRGRADRAASAARGLQVPGVDQSHVPHIGWGIFGYFEQRRDETNRAIAEATENFNSGATSFHVASVGWMTTTSVAARIEQATQAITDLRTSIDAGSFTIHYPALGWVTRVSLEACLEQQRDRIAELGQQIADGSYSVHLPHIGWTTRNALQTALQTTRDELAALEAQVAARELTIHRSPGWITGQSVQNQIDDLSRRRSELEAQVAEGGFTHSLMGYGWTTGQSLQAQIDQIDADVASVRAQLSAGTYSVPIAGGAIDANSARAALARPDCRPQGPSPCTARESRPALQDALARIPRAGAFDIEYRLMERRHLVATLAVFGQHATPALHANEVQRRIHERLQDEFAQELALHRSRLERRIDWLLANLELIP